MVRPTGLRSPASGDFLNSFTLTSGDRDSPPSARGRTPPTHPRGDPLGYGHKALLSVSSNQRNGLP